MWEKEINGNKILSGKIGFNGVLILAPNKFKSKDTDPDYILWLKEDEKK